MCSLLVAQARAHSFICRKSLTISSREERHRRFGQEPVVQTSEAALRQSLPRLELVRDSNTHLKWFDRVEMNILDTIRAFAPEA